MHNLPPNLLHTLTSIKNYSTVQKSGANIHFFMRCPWDSVLFLNKANNLTKKIV